MICKNENLRNIRRQFSVQTGVALEEKKAMPVSASKILSVAVVVCLIGALLLMPGRHYGNSIVLTVNAADGAPVELGEKPVVVEYDFPFAEAAYGNVEGMTTGTEVLKYSVNIQGEGIEHIRYAISDAEQAWFQQQFEMSEAEFYRRAHTGDDEYPIYRGMSEQPGIWTATSYLGAEYSVPYREQDAREIYLEYRVEKNERQWIAADISIAIEIFTEDGDMIRKALLIQPQAAGPDMDGISSVKISVVDA